MVNSLEMNGRLVSRPVGVSVFDVEDAASTYRVVASKFGSSTYRRLGDGRESGDGVPRACLFSSTGYSIRPAAPRAGKIYAQDARFIARIRSNGCH